MSGEAVRECTPVEILRRDIESIITTPLKEEERRNQIIEAISKALCYEQDYLKHQYVAVDCHCKNLTRENELLKVQNRVLAEYILFNEGEFIGRA